jgi:hypothetical protein
VKASTALITETGVARQGHCPAVVCDLDTQQARPMRHADLNGSVAVKHRVGDELTDGEDCIVKVSASQHAEVGTQSTSHDADGASLGEHGQRQGSGHAGISAMVLCLLVEAGLPEGSTSHYDAVRHRMRRIHGLSVAIGIPFRPIAVNSRRGRATEGNRRGRQVDQAPNDLVGSKPGRGRQGGVDPQPAAMATGPMVDEG